MIQKELKELIDQFCMGKEPTDQEFDMIMDAVNQSGADSMEVDEYINKIKAGPTKEEYAKAQRLKQEAENNKVATEVQREARMAAQAKQEQKRKAIEKLREESKRKKEQRDIELEAATNKADEEARLSQRRLDEMKRRNAEAIEEKSATTRKLQDKVSDAEIELQVIRQKQREKAEKEKLTNKICYWVMGLLTLSFIILGVYLYLSHEGEAAMAAGLLTGILGLFISALVGWILEKILRLVFHLDIEMGMQCMKD